MKALSDGPFAIWVGYGARDAAAEIAMLARRMRAPVMCSPRGKGIFPEDDPLFVGVTGLAGHASVMQYLEQSPAATHAGARLPARRTDLLLGSPLRSARRFRAHRCESRRARRGLPRRADARRHRRCAEPRSGPCSPASARRSTSRSLRPVSLAEGRPELPRPFDCSRSLRASPALSASRNVATGW